MPDFSYAELDKRLGRAPTVVVIPAFPDVSSPQNKPVLNCIRQQSARGIAQHLHYPSYAFVDAPQVQQESAGAALTLVGLINIVFHPLHPAAGVLLYDGAGELDLASIFDTYAASYTSRLLSVAQTRQLITTRHGLQLVPRWGFSEVPALDRLIVPGSQARQLTAAGISAWQSQANAAPVFYPHADKPDSFAFDTPLFDLARQENNQTAMLAAKRLEYRPGTIQTEGARWPLLSTLYPLLVGSVSLAGAVVLSKRWRRRTLTRFSGVAVQAHA